MCLSYSIVSAQLVGRLIFTTREQFLSLFLILLLEAPSNLALRAKHDSRLVDMESVFYGTVGPEAAYSTTFRTALRRLNQLI